MKRFSIGQLNIPFDTTQPRLTKHEERRVYNAVLIMRAAGFKVYRHGRWDHSIDGQISNNECLRQRARILLPAGVKTVKEAVRVVRERRRECEMMDHQYIHQYET